MKTTKTISLSLGFTVLLTGCAVGPNYERPTVNSPAMFRNQKKVQDASIADLPWWNVFKDKTLQKLIAEALVNNYDVLVAAARVEQARAVVGQSAAPFYPNIGYQGVVTQGQNQILGSPAFNSAVSNSSTFVGANASWEIDLWGRIRRSNEAARAQLLSSEASQRGVMLTLLSNVAQNYYDLLEQDLELKITYETVKSYQGILTLFTERLQGGVASKLDTSRAEASLASASARIPQLNAAIAVKENQICILLGRNPGPIQRTALLNDEALPPSVPAGLPAALLDRRPDVLQAEDNLHAACAQIGVSIAQFFPQLSLTAFLGRVSPQISAFTLGTANAWAAAANLVGPIFEGGALVAGLKESKSVFAQQKFTYQQTALNALSEVANALVTREQLVDERVQEARAVEALKVSVQVSEERYTAGKASYYEVLEAQNQLFPAQITLAQTDANQRIVIVQLYTALGGGWNLNNQSFTAGKIVSVPPNPTPQATPAAQPAPSSAQGSGSKR